MKDADTGSSGGIISGESMKGAVEIVKYCNSDFKKITKWCCNESCPEETIEEKLIGSLRLAGADGMTVRDLQRRTLRKLKNAEKIKAFMQTMIRDGWPIRAETIKHSGNDTFKYYYCKGGEGEAV